MFWSQGLTRGNTASKFSSQAGQEYKKLIHLFMITVNKNLAFLKIINPMYNFFLPNHN